MIRPDQKPLKPFTAWIARASTGHPAFFLGYYRTKMELVSAYSERFGQDLERAGYRIAKVRIEAQR